MTMAYETYVYVCPKCGHNKAEPWTLSGEGPVKCANCGYLAKPVKISQIKETK